MRCGEEGGVCLDRDVVGACKNGGCEDPVVGPSKVGGDRKILVFCPSEYGAGLELAGVCGKGGREEPAPWNKSG